MGQSILNNERAMTVPATASDGPARRTAHMTITGVQFAGNFAGGWDVKLEGAFFDLPTAGTNWVSISGDIVAAGVLDTSGTDLLNVSWSQLRVVTNTAGDNAPPTVSLVGHKRNDA